MLSTVVRRNGGHGVSVRAAHMGRSIPVPLGRREISLLVATTPRVPTAPVPAAYYPSRRIGHGRYSPPRLIQLQLNTRSESTSTSTSTAAAAAPITLPPLPFFTFLARYARNKPAIIDSPSGSGSARAYTYGQLLRDVSLGRDRLLDLHRAPQQTEGDTRSLNGARVAFLVPNSYHYVTTLLAIWAAGGVAVPLCVTHPAKELAYVIRDSGAGMVVGTSQYTPKLNEAVEIAQAESTAGGEGEGEGEGEGVREVQITRVEKLFTPLDELVPTPSTKSTPVKWLRANPARSKTDLETLVWFQKPALIIYTSGTTSLPKGVVLTHLNLQAQAASLSAAWKYTQHDHLLHVLPLHHIHGILNCLLTPLFAGGAVEFLPLPLDPARILRRLAAPYLDPTTPPAPPQAKITLLMAVPTIYTKLIDAFHAASFPGDVKPAVTAALGALRLAVSGSAALPGSTRRAWEGISGGGTLLERYGMTEVGMAVSCGLDPAKGEQPENAVGWPLPGYEIGLRSVPQEAEPGEGDLNPTPTPTPPPENSTQEGEILIRGPGVFNYYHNRPTPPSTPGDFLPATYTPDIATLHSSGIKTRRTPFPALPRLLNAHSVPPGLAPSTRAADYPWFITGDYARLVPVGQLDTPPGLLGGGDTQLQPAIRILGRLSSDIINSGGEKLSALELEREISALCGPAGVDAPPPSGPGLGRVRVKEVCVVGLPSRTWGEVAAAVLVVDGDAGKEGGGDVDQAVLGAELKSLLRERVARWKVPRVVRVIVVGGAGEGAEGEGREGGLPRNAMGKVLKREVVRGVFKGWTGEEEEAN